MDRATQNFFALLTMLDASRGDKRPRSPAEAAARAVVKHEILPVLLAGFENHPQLDVPEILELCVPALTEVLRNRIER